MVWFRQFGQCLCQRWLCYHMNVRLNCQGSLSLILRMLIFMPTKYKCSLCSSFLPGTHHQLFFLFSIYFLSITCTDYFLPVTEKQFTHFRRREVLLCCFIGSDQEQQLSSLHVDRHLVLMVNVFDPAYITREKWPKNGRLCRFVI